MLHALRGQAKLRGETRQKQLVDATNLLLKIAKDLRQQIASHPEDPDNSQTERLEQIQKLARVIQDREKAEDDVSSDLAKVGVW
jgi:septal ring factor EnvC (AmiA/AmiB activator)